MRMLMTKADRCSSAALRSFSAFLAVGILALAGCAGSRPSLPKLRDTLSVSEESELKLGVSLSADTAVDLALKNNLELELLKEDIRVLRALRLSSFQIEDPQLRVGFGDESSTSHQTETVPGTSTPWFAGGDAPPATGNEASHSKGESVQVALRFFPPNPWTQSHKNDQADYQVLAAQSQLDSARWQMEKDVRLAFESVIYLERDVRLLDGLLAIYSHLVDVEEKRAESKAATAMDVLTASRRRLAAASDLQRGKRDYANARLELAALMGINASTLPMHLEKPSLPYLDADRLSVDKLEAAAMEHRADLQAYHWQAQAARASMEEAEAAMLPWFTHFQVSYGKLTREEATDPVVAWVDDFGSTRDILNRDTSSSGLEREEWQISFGIEMPIFSSINGTAPEQAVYRRARTQLDVGWHRTLNRVKNGMDRLEQTAANLRDYSKVSAPHVQKLQELLEQVEAETLLPPNEESRIRAELLENARVALDLDSDHRRAIILLEYAIGAHLAGAD